MYGRAECHSDSALSKGGRGLAQRTPGREARGSGVR
jgi:hypothetical protein